MHFISSVFVVDLTTTMFENNNFGHLPKKYRSTGFKECYNCSSPILMFLYIFTLVNTFEGLLLSICPTDFMQKPGFEETGHSLSLFRKTFRKFVCEKTGHWIFVALQNKKNTHNVFS